MKALKKEALGRYTFKRFNVTQYKITTQENEIFYTLTIIDRKYNFLVCDNKFTTKQEMETSENEYINNYDSHKKYIDNLYN